MADHLVVFQHGIGGTPAELRNVADALELAFPGRLRSLLSQANEGNTLDGVAAGGARLAELVRQQTPEPGGRLSFVCHSLGGIYARQALLCLEADGWLAACGLQLVNFVTTASPHLGITEAGAHWHWAIWALQWLLPATIADLALESEALPELCGEVALRALARFRRRAVYGNVGDDLWVRVGSALLSTGAGPLPLVPGVPEAVEERPLPAEPPAEGELAEFPADQHLLVAGMLRRLATLRWERYALHFPYDVWSGAAHAKICNHAYQDMDNDGKHVVFHICETFVDRPGEGTPNSS